jgi:hypothetical protein
MTIERTIEILDALANGCSPLTGELISNDSVLNEREVILALERAIVLLENKTTESSSSTENLIPEEEIKHALQLFENLNYKPTYGRLTTFFLRAKLFSYSELNTDKLYGKYRGQINKIELRVFFSKYLLDNGYTLHGRLKSEKNYNIPVDDTFFQEPVFNNFSDESIENLKRTINNMELVKIEDLTETVIQARKAFRRAFEPWFDVEYKLLEDALKNTNDLLLLSQCFQRSKSSILNASKKFLRIE